MRVFLFSIVLFVAACGKKSDTPQMAPALNRLLVFTETSGYRHESIEAGVAMFNKQAAAWNVVVTHSVNSSDFTTENLRNYDVIVFLSNTGTVFEEPERLALQQYVRNGGRIMGIHFCIDAEPYWGWYGQLFGARFVDHPVIQPATCKVLAHPATSGLPAQWVRSDEWYNFKSLAADNNPLITVDETTYTGGTHGAYHPVSWYRYFDGGKVFYTAMGHDPSYYSEELFIAHIKAGLTWLVQQ
jgi:type 1 glutamine amidotransferase